MISFVIFDFDGVFTDGNIQFLNNQIIKTYNVKDGMGIRLLKKAGIHIGVLSGYKNNESQKKILEHFDISFVKLNCDNKLKVLNDWCNQLNLPLNQVAYMGDDLNDLSIMKQVGLTGSPLDACDEVKNISNFISIKKGGKGCVRDFCEYIIKKNSKKISTPKINIQQLEKKIFIFCGPNVIES